MGLGIVKWVQKAGWKVSEREYPVFSARVADIATHPPRGGRDARRQSQRLGDRTPDGPLSLQRRHFFKTALRGTQHGHLKQALDFYAE
jgi:hypothetical protein